MIPCRVVFNHLPSDVLTQVLRVDELSRHDPRWRLLRSGNTRRTYLFSPARGEPAWVVKWGCRYTSLKKVRDALSGRDQAIVEWEKTCEASRSGLPVVDFALLAQPRPISGRLHSLLVAPYLEDSLNFLQFLARHRRDRERVGEALRHLGRIVANIHARSLLHLDLSLDNLLVLGADSSRIVVLDWFKMRPLRPDSPEARREDLIAPLCDMFYAGLAWERMLPFLEGYAERERWVLEQSKTMVDEARQARLDIMHRAWRNCNWRSRGVVRFRCNGYQVFCMKGQDSDRVRRAIENGEVQPESRPRCGVREDSARLEAWRKANLLRAGGLGGHYIAAYAVRRGLSKIREILIPDASNPGTPLSRLFESASLAERRDVLEKAGDYIRHMHELNVRLKHCRLDRWFYLRNETGEPELATRDLESIEPFGQSQARFGWMQSPEIQILGWRSLFFFLNGYYGFRVKKDAVRDFLAKHFTEARGEKG